LLLIFLVCFTGLHYITPLTPFFPSVYEFIPAAVVNKLTDRKAADIVNLPVKDSLPLSSPPVELPAPETDSTADSLEVISDTLKVIPDSGSVIMEPAPGPMQVFTDSLAKTKGQTRIIYYGDSQLEGDRITSYLRERLRKKAGGTGPGLFLPLMPVMYTKSVWIRSSQNWQRYNYLSYQKKEISHREFGPFMVICRYLPENDISESEVKAVVRIKPSLMADSSVSKYDFLKIFYRNTEGPVNVTVYGDEKQIAGDSLRTAEGIHVFSCNLNRPAEVKVEFSGHVSPDIFGISIESDHGVIVDNIAQRGSAGLEFTMVDRRNLEESYRLLSPDLIILQYGLNIVRNVRDDYSYYQKGLTRQLAVLKKVAPNTPVLLVSLTDMGIKEGDSIRSYPNIPHIINAQKDAAEQEDITFWDAWEAMGGQNSIFRWSQTQPPLAQKDLTHLTYDGADSLARMMVDSLFTIPRHDSVVVARADSIPYKPEPVTNTPVVQPANEPSRFRVLVGSIFSYDVLRPLIFSAASFWLFLLVVLAGYSIVYKKLFLRNFYLLLASLFFYYKSGGIFLLLLIFVIVVDYSCGLLIGNSRRKYVRKFFIIFSILSNLSILAYFKYTGFIVNTINELFGTNYQVYDFLAGIANKNLGTAFNISNIILPVGISFFTFQSLSYTIDVYRRKIRPVSNIIDFGFYVSFFPQLVAGPIVRASEFIPQLYNKFHLDKREFGHALFLISKGLIKKIIISDFIAINFIDRVFDAPSLFSGFENLMAIYGYGLQIYCDFSGYTDIAIGIGLLFGFRLPVNFNSPYKAQGISDFWKRWHISLSRWLKDYLYIPLGGNRKGKFRTNVNLMLTMLLGGLWHGADLRFIIWGFLHGLGLVVDRLWHLIFRVQIPVSGMRRFISVFLTFQFVSFCWIFFRAPDLGSIRIMLWQIGQNFAPGSWMTVLPGYSTVFLLIIAGYIVHFLPERVRESYRGIFIKIPLVAKLAVIFVIAVALFGMRSTEVMPFIYFRF
jgi:D-alanyl-lipoteichoic acid acyltransferase DltB (MBOAT superfamily)/lysophospholipase L1-like esterase